MANNPILEGIVNTYATDVVGQQGPRLQVHSSNPQYNERLEKLWRTWFANPDINGVLSGPDVLRLWVRALFPKGEYLTQIVTDPQAKGPVQMRLHCLDADLLETPPSLAGDAHVALGVRRTKTGRPTQYYLRDEEPMGAYRILTAKHTPLPADVVLHGFVPLEPGQARGVPWLAVMLQVIADLRDYDTEVLAAARVAANQALWFYTDHPDAPYMHVNESTDIERGTASTAPPGWKPFALSPTQPATNYVSYRTERLRELGRPINMPLMMVRLGSEDHNYSSARFDGQIYQRGIGCAQTMFERPLNRCVDEVAREAELARALPPRPADVSYVWLHNKPPHVDPSKEANAERTYLENGTLTLEEALAAQGKDLDEHLEALRRINQALEKIGVKLVWQYVPPAPVMPGEEVGSAA
jgi:lambda family phage portal protein